MDGESFTSVNFSNVSLANVTVACADDLTVLRFDAGICRFVNHPLPETEVFASSVIGLMPLRIDTSKLFERLDFLRLVRLSGSKKLLDFCGCCFCVLKGVEMTEATGVVTSLIRFISVAEEANDESKEMRSVLVQIMPALLEGVGACDTLGDSIMLGFSDARRKCGIGASVVAIKSEKRLLV